MTDTTQKHEYQSAFESIARAVVKRVGGWGFWLCVFGLIVMFAGEPDLHDALVSSLMVGQRP